MIAALLLGITPLIAAPILISEEAVQLALEKNFSLVLAQNETALATLNRKTGIGPFLPSLSASASHGGSLKDSSASQTSVGASLNLIVFDGFQNYHAYQRLKSQEKSAVLLERMAVEALLESVLVSYFEIVRQQRRLEAIRDLLSVSEERAKLAQAKMELGAGSKLEQLQSLADLNADSSSFLSQEMGLDEAKIRLNVILSRDAATEFAVTDSIPLQDPLPVEAWQASLEMNNASILSAQAQLQSSQSGLKQAKGGRLPNVNAGLAYSAQPEVLNSGPGAGRDDFRYSVNVSVPLFDRMQTRRSIGTAQWDQRQAETRFRQKESEILSDFEQAKKRHGIGMHQVHLEERNLEVARLQAEAARERFRVGSSSPLEFRDAQRKLLDAQSRWVSARQDAKTAELALKRLAGIMTLSPTGAEKGLEKK